MLEHLSPREFEEYCQALLMCHYKCVVLLTPPTNDGGRDLLVQHPHGLIVVECKHYPTGVVGRPVIQKLHSAVITENTTKGMIITTGRFSADAEDRAQNLQDIQIELVDSAKLAHLISTTYSSGLIPLNLCAAIRTTPDAIFPQIFAQSIFEANRYDKGTRFTASVRVDVKRVTQYLAYYTARFQAEGKLKSAAGTIRESWDGSVWVRADNSEADFGSPPGASGHLLYQLADVLKTVDGPTVSPKLQPHQAIAEMKNLIVNNCVKIVSYLGRNNVSYSRQITPSRNNIDINSLLLCYVPHQAFVLQIGSTSHQGGVEEQASPPGFIVKCQTLSECTVCGTATTASTQVLCCVCFKPAHRWSFFFPDSFRCKVCGGLVCRQHTVRGENGLSCTRCDSTGKALRPRWFSHFFWGVIACLVITAIVVLLMGYKFATATTLIGATLCIASWSPLLCVLLQSIVRKKHAVLFYRKKNAAI